MIKKTKTNIYLKYKHRRKRQHKGQEQACNKHVELIKKYNRDDN